MILDEREVAGIVGGRIDRVFRVWTKPSAKAGSQLRSHGAVVAIGAVERLARDALSPDDARRAGLLAELERQADG